MADDYEFAADEIERRSIWRVANANAVASSCPGTEVEQIQAEASGRRITGAVPVRLFSVLANPRIAT